MIVDMELLPHGSIRRFFQEHEVEPVLPNLLALPDDPRQCAHIDVNGEMLSEGYVVDRVRCSARVARGAQNGWLCERHQGLLDRFYHVPHDPYVNYDQMVIDALIARERRMLKHAVRERVRLTAKGSYIEYVIG